MRLYYLFNDDALSLFAIAFFRQQRKELCSSNSSEDISGCMNQSGKNIQILARFRNSLQDLLLSKEGEFLMMLFSLWLLTNNREAALKEK